MNECAFIVDIPFVLSAGTGERFVQSLLPWPMQHQRAARRTAVQQAQVENVRAAHDPCTPHRRGTRCRASVRTGVKQSTS
jgi:hypothetical protein